MNELIKRDYPHIYCTFESVNGGTNNLSVAQYVERGAVVLAATSTKNWEAAVKNLKRKIKERGIKK